MNDSINNPLAGLIIILALGLVYGALLSLVCFAWIDKDTLEQFLKRFQESSKA